MALDPSPVAQTTSAWIGMIGVLIGAFVTGGFLLLSQWLARRSEERRQRRELAINTALANWKSDVETIKYVSEKGMGGSVAPLDTYIVHMVKLCALIERKNLTEEDITNELRRIRESAREATDTAIKEEQERNKKSHL